LILGPHHAFEGPYEKLFQTRIAFPSRRSWTELHQPSCRYNVLFEGRYVGRIDKAVSHAPREVPWFWGLEFHEWAAMDLSMGTPLIEKRQ